MGDKVKFWGVRGSIASPGPTTTTVGGNTSCVEVRLGGERIIIDGGTGLRALGAEQGATPMRVSLLFSHLHWDHIQGIPFFGPLYDPRCEFTLYGPEGLEAALRDQMSRPTFPVGMDVMGAKRQFVTIAPGDSFRLGDVRIETFGLNHPGGAIGYRLGHAGKVIAYVCDHEADAAGSDGEVLKLAANADVLIVDAQYLPEEYGDKVGWGHGTYELACALAEAARVKQLVLTHHEPGRSDAGVGEIEMRARKLFADCWAAREGMELDLNAEKECLPIHRILEAYLASALASG